jgi:hypothetical protein
MPAQEGRRPRGRSRSNPALKYDQQVEVLQQEQLAAAPQQEVSAVEAKKVYHHSRKASKPEMSKEINKVLFRPLTPSQNIFSSILSNDNTS